MISQAKNRLRTEKYLKSILYPSTITQTLIQASISWDYEIPALIFVDKDGKIVKKMCVQEELETYIKRNLIKSKH